MLAHPRATAHIVVGKGVALFGFICNFMQAEKNQMKVSNHLVGSKKTTQCFSWHHGLSDVNPIIAELGKDLEKLNDLTLTGEDFKTLGIASVFFSSQI